MELSGNGVVNTIYEASMNPKEKEFDTQDKWQVQELRSAFVKKKYEKRLFWNETAYKGQVMMRRDPEHERMLLMSLNLLSKPDEAAATKRTAGVG